MRHLGKTERPRAGWPAVVSVAAFVFVVICTAILLSALALTGPAASAHASPDLSGATISASFPSGKPAPPRITCTAAILIDAETGEILFSHNANARLPMASTTKIMTAMIVLEELELDTEVTISSNAVSTIGSKSALVEGEVLTVEQLLYALLVVSGNDAGVALAEATAGSVPAFVEKMNAKADALGLSNTNFVNPCGLNNKKHFSSAKDLATLAQYALKDPVFSRIVDTVYFSLPPLDEVPPGAEDNLRDFDNQNELLHRLPWVTGVKTGSTPYAHYCVVASGTVEGVSLVAVILGATEDETRWKEGRALLEYGLDLHPRTLLCTQGQPVTELDISDHLGRKVPLVTDEPLVARLSESDAVTPTLVLDQDVTCPVEAGDLCGTVEFTLDGESLGSVNLIAAQSVPKPTIKMILDYWRDRCPPQLWPGS